MSIKESFQTLENFIKQKLVELSPRFSILDNYSNVEKQENYQLVKVYEDEHNDAGDFYIAYAEDFHGEPAKPNEISLYELVTWLDENANGRDGYHRSFETTHSLLCVMLLPLLGYEKTKEFFWQLAEFGGLDIISLKLDLRKALNGTDILEAYIQNLVNKE